MKNYLSYRTAVLILLSIISLFVVLHLLILTGIVPYQFVWGGRINSRSDMISFEIISLIVNLIMLAVILIKAGFLKLSVNQVSINVALWIMVILFTLNTLGNFLSNNPLEKMLFTPLTVILGLCSYTLATDKKTE